VAGGELFVNALFPAAMIDRLVHHAEIIGLKGDSYRLRDKDLEPRALTADPTPD
jgi:DNA replication protein DnaC